MQLLITPSVDRNRVNLYRKLQCRGLAIGGQEQGNGKPSKPSGQNQSSSFYDKVLARGLENGDRRTERRE